MRRKIKALFLDMDGVLWRDLEPIGDLQANFSLAGEKGFQLAFITNNATRTVSHYQTVFSNLGIEIAAEQIYTSANITAKILRDKFPQGGNIFIIGEEGLQLALESVGFQISDQDCVAVVAALDRKLTYEKLKQATLLIHSGIPFYGTNPDPTLPTPRGLIPGAGALIAALESASGRAASIIGKPQPAMLQAALADLKLQPSQALMVGDRLETDILAGQNATCQTALVLTGASSIEDAQKWQPAPDFIAPDFAVLLKEL